MRKNIFAEQLLEDAMNILGVDDNKTITDFLETVLTSRGHKFTGINDGKKGLDLIKQIKFDVILLDIGMPYFSGLDIIEELSTLGILHKHNILLVTASSMDDEMLSKLVKKGIKGWVRKPFQVDVLLEEIKKFENKS